MDRILIRALEVPCLVGINPEERVQKQTIRVDVDLECDLSPGTRSDRIEDTLNYRTLNKKMILEIRNSRYGLIEALAERLCALCLEDQRVRCATVRIEKPGALRYARGVAVELVRRSPEPTC